MIRKGRTTQYTNTFKTGKTEEGQDTDTWEDGVPEPCSTEDGDE